MPPTSDDKDCALCLAKEFRPLLVCVRKGTIVRITEDVYRVSNQNKLIKDNQRHIHKIQSK